MSAEFSQECALKGFRIKGVCVRMAVITVMRGNDLLVGFEISRKIRPA
jgi:hypothetical protein